MKDFLVRMMNDDDHGVKSKTHEMQMRILSSSFILSLGLPCLVSVFAASSANTVEVSADGSVLSNDSSSISSSLELLHTGPRLTYGTAWKKDATVDLVYNALRAGFRHIDTACQPKHYNEKGVGDGWTLAAAELGLTRKDVWLQTKYTSIHGQDPNSVPYDKKADLVDQVRQSLEKSLENLQTTYIDSLVMHGLEETWDENLTVWRVFESFVDAGKVGQIGVSNLYDVGAIRYLYEQARIKPAVVQNRFYADSGYDTAIRKFCTDHGMEYQSFWTLGANRHFLRDERVIVFAKQKQLTPETTMYATVLALGITPLDGTTSKDHMAEDIELLNRIRNGEEIVSKDDLAVFVKILGISEYESPG